MTNLSLNKQDYNLLRKYRTREVEIISGASGAGKTLLMTGQIADDLMAYHLINKAYEPLIGTSLLPKPLQVWSNYHVELHDYIASFDGGTWKDADKPVTLSTFDLDVEKLYTFSPEMREGKVYIDELDLIADRQDWQSGGSKLLVAILRQIRKRHMSMVGSIQSIDWLNPRFYFQIDTMVACRDASVTAWGKENELDPGEMTFLYAKDRSGLKTGYQYSETGEVYESWFRGEIIKQLYDTNKEFNPFEHMVSYTVKRKHKEIDASGESQAIPGIESANDTIADILTSRVSSGVLKMPVKDISDELADKGFNVKKAELLEHLELVHNARVYGKMGYSWVNLDNVTNIKCEIPKDAKRTPIRKRN